MRFFIAIMLLLSSLLLASAEQLAPRPLWSRTDAQLFLTNWYMCAPFSSDKRPLHLENDYLHRQYNALSGKKELRSDGLALAWRPFTLLDNPPAATVNPLAPLPGADAAYTLNLSAITGEAKPQNINLYAFTSLSAEEATTVFLLLNQSLGLAADVWVNGELRYDHESPRSASLQPVIEVPLAAGINTLLMKFYCNGEKPSFSLQLLYGEDAMLFANARPARELLIAQQAQNEKLTVYTGDALSKLQIAHRGVDIRISAAGGRDIAKGRVRYGDAISFDTGAWPAGGYDISCWLLASDDVAENRNADITPSYAHLLYFHGDAVAAARSLVSSAPVTAGEDRLAMQHKLLADIIRDRMGLTLNNLALMPDVYAALMEWEEAQLPMRDNGRPPSDWFIRLAYRSEIDDSAQYAGLYLPPDYDPAKRYPLIVLLHGMTRISPPYYRWYGSSLRNEQLADRYGAIVLRPHGRGNAWYRGLGEQDVLQAISLAKAQLSIDEDRVYLVGSSMGGAGVWHIGAANPQIFAALAPFFGGREPRVTTPANIWASMTARQLRYAERDSSFAQIESLFSTPVFVSHGDKDASVPVDITRYGVRLLRNWGYPVQYWEIPGKAHGDLLTDDAVYPQLLAEKRISAPTTVRLHAASLAAAQVHWLQVIQREDAAEFVSAEAVIIAGELLRIESNNALALRLTPPASLLNPQKPLQIIWNGKKVVPQENDPQGILLYAEGYQPNGLEKQARVEGPLGDIFNTPFLIVIGTSSTDEDMRAYCLRYARRMLAWWQQFQQVTPRIAYDHAVTNEDIARYSLLLVGGPGENLISRQLRDNLPVNFDDRGFSIDGFPFALRDGGLRLIYPNPKNNQRYLVLAAANSAAGMYRLPLFNNRYDVDYSLTDGSSGQEFASGLFDRNWHISRNLLETGTAGSNLPPVPRTVHADVPDKQLYLNELLETNALGDFDYLPGIFPNLAREVSIGKQRYTHSLAMPYLENPLSALEYNIYQSNWTHFSAVLALQKPAAAPAVVFIVKGDGKELFRSYPFAADTPSLAIDIPIKGVSILRLEMEWQEPAPFGSIACWCDARLEK